MWTWRSSRSWSAPRGPRVETFRAEVAALLFDMDGVLVDSRAVVERTWRRWSARHRVDVMPILRIAHGRRTSDTLRATVPHLATPEEVAWLDRTESEDFDDLQPIPGAGELVASIPAGRWTVVTSAGRDLAVRRLAAVGMALPPHAVTSEDVTRGKPAPDGYLLAAHRLGVDPARCLVVEDAPPGIEAGRAAGARVLAVSTTHQAGELTGAIAILGDLSTVKVVSTGQALEVELFGEVA